MKKRVLSVVLVLLVALASLSASSETTQTMEFPNLTVYDREGNEYDLTDFRGKPVVINFWASWCGPCKKEMPDFDEVYKEYGDEVHFLMINLTDGVREPLEKATAFIDSQDYSFPVYYDTAQSAVNTLMINSIPMTVFLDSKGHGIAYAMGSIGKNTIVEGIKMVKEIK